jgi:hypothetical protein
MILTTFYHIGKEVENPLFMNWFKEAVRTIVLLVCVTRENIVNGDSG